MFVIEWCKEELGGRGVDLGSQNGKTMHSLIPLCVLWIFYTVDGERCGKTIVDLFANAKEPDNIVVGIIDQSYEEDIYCLEAYCKQMGKYLLVAYPLDGNKTHSPPPACCCCY